MQPPSLPEVVELVSSSESWITSITAFSSSSPFVRAGLVVGVSIGSVPPGDCASTMVGGVGMVVPFVVPAWAAVNAVRAGRS